MLPKTSNIFRIIRTTAAVLAAAAAVFGCKESVPGFEMPGAGIYYRVTLEGDGYFARIDDTDSTGTVNGHFYMAGRDSSAVRHDFTARVRHRKLTLEIDGREEKIKASRISYEPYTEPAYSEADTTLFRTACCTVRVTPDIIYGQAEGFWSSLPGVEADVSKAFTEGYIKSFRRRTLDLKLDLYRPGGTESLRPLIFFLHGGAFYVGDKQEPAFVDFCRYFTSLGYVTASVNYRLGFHVGKGDIERAGYAALQDAHAAMRFLVAHAAEYGIDVNRIYLAGSSAGSITALNLAFMTEKDRPQSSHGTKGLLGGGDMGRIDSSGNDIKARFRVRCVANMWGAVRSTEMLRNSRTGIISFHGDADTMVPYREGYPFSSTGRMISRTLSDNVYGSACIDSAARAAGLRSRLITFKGEGHALNTTGKDKQPNSNHYLIRNHIRRFFFSDMVPERASICDEGGGTYSISCQADSLRWKVEGGFITGSTDRSVTILWREDDKVHSIAASGLYPGGIGFVTSLR